MKTKCPNCLAVYSIATAAEKQLGRIARCGKCQQTFPLFAWEGNVTAGESFEALLEEFLLPLGPQRVGATENEPDENSGMSSLPAPQAGEQEAPQEPLLTRPQEEAGLPQQIRADRTVDSDVAAIVSPSPSRPAAASQAQRREVSSELVGSDDERDWAQERLATICFLTVASLFALALVAYFLWPKGTVNEVADPEPFGPLQTAPPSTTPDNQELAVVNPPGMMAKIAPDQGGQPPPGVSKPESDLTLLARPGTTLRVAEPNPDPPRDPPASPPPAPRPPPLPGYGPGPPGVNPPLGSPVTPSSPATEQSETMQHAAESVALIRTSKGWGSGFVVADNILATNRHVVQDAHTEEMTVSFPDAGDERLNVGRVVYEDWGRDLTLIEVQTDRRPLLIARDYNLKENEQVTLISNPSVGKGITVRNIKSSGTVMCLVTLETGYDYYQFNAMVNNGSSGGPVLNQAGQVVAVVAMKAREEATSELRKRMGEVGVDIRPSAPANGMQAPFGLAFGIPVHALAQALASVEEQGESASVKANDEHAARVLLQRLAVLGRLHLLETQLNVPPQVREELARRQPSLPGMGSPPRKRGKKPRVEVELIPEHLIPQLHAELQSVEVRALFQDCARDLTERLRDLQDSQQLDDTVKENLQGLFNRVKNIEKLSRRPPREYDEYSTKLVAHQQSLEEYVTQLATELGMRATDPGDNNKK